MERTTTTTTSDVDRFRDITAKMADTFEVKNEAYGNSFGRSVQKYGKIAALTRISDKFNRIENLMLGSPNRVVDESVKDTLLDLACYCVMTLIELDKNGGEVCNAQ